MKRSQKPAADRAACTSCTATVDPVYTLCPSQSDSFARRLRYLYDLDVETEAFLEQSALLAGSLPSALRLALDRFRRAGNAGGYLHIRGLPEDAAGTGDPHEGYQRIKPTAESVLATLAGPLGDIVGFMPEQGGRLFQTIAPRQSEATAQTSASSRTVLDFHTELAAVPSPQRPDFLSLFCVRGDRDGEALTLVSPVRRMLSAVPPDLQAELWAPQFQTGIDEAWGGSAGNSDGPIVSVLSGSTSDPLLNLDVDLMRATTPEAEEALAAMNEAARREHSAISLEPGEAVIIDNRRATHARSSYEPRWDGKDRWLVRSLIVADIGRTARRPPSRVLTVSM